jgi:hypothetical protein
MHLPRPMILQLLRSTRLLAGPADYLDTYAGQGTTRVRTTYPVGTAGVAEGTAPFTGATATTHENVGCLVTGLGYNGAVDACAWGLAGALDATFCATVAVGLDPEQLAGPFRLATICRAA